MMATGSNLSTKSMATSTQHKGGDVVKALYGDDTNL